MSGHSKWANIKRKKEKTDGQRAKIFTKIGREITVAAREGGADPANNSKLATLIAKAKANNVPNDNIERLLKKAGDSKENYEEITYEGYGPSGVAVIVETLTDNRNRTAGDLRHYFDKCGGNLGQNGSVAFLFDRKGMIYIQNEDNKIEEEKAMDDAFEAGAADFNYEDEMITITTEPNDVAKVAGALEGLGYTYESAEVEYLPMTKVQITDEELVQKMEKLLDMFDDNDDVQNVYHNWDAPEEDDED
ncbi:MULTISPECIES: YebC/PmpR family DNA-binding transcriptional regulator [Anaerotruncus]|jgi:YebC/PmpR family DNA-binding regulatory protein|uniref:YebC/PmpR family DNA-binding transcriptional regulator n=1 Tax=Anaerotruncus TaxID=244127 RepID=UPI0008363EA7|nr:MULTISPECIES: YebC/PmpR family DNA-binding transcriptional regulator [Anaerotruncus]RGX54780.1 YebC/PmpR family DNA-binding transcriptional regulator [Anaerotruncus sp. AF02-27]